MSIDPTRLCASLTAAGCVTPALVIDLAQVERNIAAVLRCVGDPVRWRPHVKTAKQARIIALLLDAGVTHFKCATVPELRLVLDTARHHGRAVDVLLAYPVALARLPELAALARSYTGATVGVTADDPAHLAAIVAAGTLAPWLDVDVGMHRTGSPAATWRQWAHGAGAAATPIAGIQGYEGQLGPDDAVAAAAIYDELAALARALSPGFVLTSGSLAFALALRSRVLGDGPWIHQIGAGTLVLGDVASAAVAAGIGAGASTVVAARVIARPGAGRITLDAGSKALAPDRAPPNCAVLGQPHWHPERPSEEHLPVSIGDAPPPGRDAMVLLVPDHVCTTVNLHRDVIYVRDGALVGTGTVEAGGHEPPLPRGWP